MNAPVIRSSHHGNARISSTHDCEMFQSSLTSWSSKIIVDGTVESSQRMSGSDQDSRYSCVYSSKSAISSPGGSRTSRRARMNAIVAGGSFVGVDLVAQQQQPVRPLRGAFLELPGVAPERVDAESVRMIGRRKRVRRALRCTDPAGAEDEPGLTFALAHVDRRRGPSILRRPYLHAVESNVVGIDRARLEILDHDECVVVSEDMERARFVPEHLDDRGAIGLDPDGGRRRADVTKQRTDDDARLFDRPRIHGGHLMRLTSDALRSRLTCPCGPVAQLVEQGTFNPKVAGSKPARPTQIVPQTVFFELRHTGSQKPPLGAAGCVVLAARRLDGWELRHLGHRHVPPALVSRNPFIAVDLDDDHADALGVPRTGKRVPQLGDRAGALRPGAE